MPGFDRIAPYYDRFSRFIFGNVLECASRNFLDKIPQNSAILIFGGGTGAVLEWLDQQDKRLHITFVDSSGTMIERSRNRGPFTTIDVDFVQQDALLFSSDISYDAIITSFFMDCFSTDELVTAGAIWPRFLRIGGTWYFTDFMKTRSVVRNLFIDVMYRFFRITASLKQQQIPDYERFFLASNFTLENSREYLNGLISSRCYRKL